MAIEEEAMDQMIDKPEVTRLTVPASPRYARVVRMLAANLATVEGLTIEEVEDVRMAAEEAFVYSLATGITDTLDVEFKLSERDLTLIFPLGAKEVADDAEEPAMAYAAFILDAVCDSYDMTDDSLILVKELGGVDVD